MDTSSTTTSINSSSLSNVTITIAPSNGVGNEREIIIQYNFHDQNEENVFNETQQSDERNTTIATVKARIIERGIQIVSIIFQGLIIPILISMLFDGLPKQSTKKVTTDDSMTLLSEPTITATIDWDEFWNRPIRFVPIRNDTSSTTTKNSKTTTTTATTSPPGRQILTLADCVTETIEKLGVTFVKIGQALSTRPDILQSNVLAETLAMKLQDDIDPFNHTIALHVLQNDLLSLPVVQNSSAQIIQSDISISSESINELIRSIRVTNNNNNSSNDMYQLVGSASIGQVYKGILPKYGNVAIKVRRPSIQDLVYQDTVLLRTLASAVEAIPSIPWINNNNKDTTKQNRSKKLIVAKIVDGVDEFMSRIQEELNYTNEVNNMKLFANLYSHRRPSIQNNNQISIDNNNKNKTDTPSNSDTTIQVVVPNVLESLCSEQVIVMEWIDGVKLTSFNDDIEQRYDDETRQRKRTEEDIENLAIIQEGIRCTLSQLLDAGILHADPHPGNLLKVYDNSTDIRNDDGTVVQRPPRLGYLDFGLVSTVPIKVRDGLVCAIAQLVLGRNPEGVADLFAELLLLPQSVIQDAVRRAELILALNTTLNEILIYDADETVVIHNQQHTTDKPIPFYRRIFNRQRIQKTVIPKFRFDNLLTGLASLITKFEFELPPYFLNNARALATLEGMARRIDPTFNVLQVAYPYALQRLLDNPSDSPIVDATFLSLIVTDTTNRRGRKTPSSSLSSTSSNNNKVLSLRKVRQLINDVAFYTGFKRRKVVIDLLQRLRKRSNKQTLFRLVLSSTYNGIFRRKPRTRRKCNHPSDEKKKKPKFGLRRLLSTFRL